MLLDNMLKGKYVKIRYYEDLWDGWVEEKVNLNGFANAYNSKGRVLDDDWRVGKNMKIVYIIKKAEDAWLCNVEGTDAPRKIHYTYNCAAEENLGGAYC